MSTQPLQLAATTQPLMLLKTPPDPPTVTGKRVALYMRVSTHDGRQTTDNQLHDLTTHAKARGWKVTATYTDQETGSITRPGLQKLLNDAKAPAASRKFDLVAFWSFDRLSREGTYKTLMYLDQLTTCGVGYESMQEPYISNLGPMGPAIVGIIAAISNMERIRITERLKSGKRRAALDGVIMGRKSVFEHPDRLVNEAAFIKAVKDSKLSVRDLSVTFHVAQGTAAKYRRQVLKSGTISARSPIVREATPEATETQPEAPEAV